MFRALKRSALLAPAAVAALVVALAATPGSIALASGGVAPYWGTATTLSTAGLALFTSADCTSATSCIAAGEVVGGSGGVPVVAAENGGAWGSPMPAGLGGSTTSGLYLSVSCMSASSCVAVGYNSAGASVPIAGSISVAGTSVTPGPASTVPLPSSPAPNASETAGLTSVSCTASACTAVGFYKTSSNQEEPMVATTSGNGSWTVSSVTPPSAATLGANLTAVSCPSGGGGCEAVGAYLNASGDIETWSDQLGGGVPQTLTPPAAAVAASGTLPSTPSPLNLGAPQSMNAISCPSSAACTAVGEYSVSGGAIDPMEVIISNGTPAAGIALPAATGLALNEISSVWCSDASNCALDGDVITAGGGGTFDPVTAYESSGIWSALTDLPGGAAGATQTIALGLGCSAVDSCLADGFQANSTLSTAAPMVDFSAPPLSVTTSSLPAAVAGVPYSATLQGAGGAGTPTWTVNGSLPAGLSLNAATGVISGTPTVPGSSSFTAQLASAGPPAQTASASLSITVAAVPKLSAGAPKVTPNGVTVQIGCSGSGSCSGTAIVTAVEHFSGKRPTAVTARVKRRTVKLTLARGSYSLNAGQLGKVTLKLTAKAKALLARLHKISGRLTLTPTGASKPSITRTVVFKSIPRKRK